jgi:hypothetical protein
MKALSSLLDVADSAFPIHPKLYGVEGRTLVLPAA